MENPKLNISNHDLQLEKYLVLENSYDEMVFPTLVTRIKALFIDVLILLLVFTSASFIIDFIGSVPDFIRGSILIFMVYLYDPVFTSFTGSTIGHKVMKLRVAKYANPEKRISFLTAMLRFIVKASLGWISFITVTGNKRKRALHDLISGSIVITT